MKFIVKWIVISLVLVSFGTSMALWLSMKQHQDKDQIKLAEFDSRITILEEQAKTLKAVYDKRLQNLEALLFIEVIPDITNKKRPITPSEAWQRNWYTKHSKQLSNIEKRLMLLEDRR